jgi:long-subunit acyl-CoA synthetase (AMP-forming)
VGLGEGRRSSGMPLLVSPQRSRSMSTQGRAGVASPPDGAQMRYNRSSSRSLRLSGRRKHAWQDRDTYDAHETMELRRRVQAKGRVQGKLEEAFLAFGDRPCLGVREGQEGAFTVLTFRELSRRCHIFGTGLSRLVRQEGGGAGPGGVGQTPFVGVVGPASPAWFVVDLACALYGLPLLTFPFPLPPSSLMPILASLGVTLGALVVTDAAIATALLPHLGASDHGVRTLVVSSPPLIVDGMRQSHPAAPCGITSMEAIEDAGAFTDASEESDPASLLSLTCLSASDPRALATSEKAWAARVGHVEEALGVLVRLSCQHPSDLMERRLVWSTVLNGGLVGLSGCALVAGGGEWRTLTADCNLLRPTVITAPPEFWRGIHKAHVEALRRATLVEDLVVGLEADLEVAKQVCDPEGGGG